MILVGCGRGACRGGLSCLCSLSPLFASSAAHPDFAGGVRNYITRHRVAQAANKGID